MILDGTLVDVCDTVGYTASIGQFLHQLLNLLRTLSDLFNEFDVTGRETIGLLRIEQR